MDFNKVFNPKSVAIVGVSASDPGGGGAGQLRTFLDMGFQGNLYPINPKGGEIMGLKAYPNVKDVPEPLDYVIVSVPARFALQVIQDCVAKGVPCAHMYTAGFSESHEEKMIKLEEEIVATARKGGMRIIGPNCVGIYCPESRMGTWLNAPKEPGSVAFLSQSGGWAFNVTFYSKWAGVRFSKVVSYGNASDINAKDLLEYLATDPKTKIITMYLEGVRNQEIGRGVLNIVKEIVKTKPVIIYKAGASEAGARAAASHTGSLAGSDRVWNAFFKQTGAIRVYSIEELVDTASAFQFLPPMLGRRIAIVGFGGGSGVAMTDICERNGLTLPLLSEASKSEIAAFTNAPGTSVGNPVDNSHLVGRDPEKGVKGTLDILSNDPSIDGFIYAYRIDLPWYGIGALTKEDAIDRFERMTTSLINFKKADAKKKPIVAVLRTSRDDLGLEAERLKMQARLVEAGIPNFSNDERAARALSNLAQYHEFIRRK